MSKETTFGAPMPRASAWAPTTPAAGPDSMTCIGSRAASAAGMSPPLDCISISGARTPMRPKPSTNRAR
jgi:hypothetical protein